eukprot:5903283-Pyramimonas_sp.AAC.1
MFDQSRGRARRKVPSIIILDSLEDELKSDVSIATDLVDGAKPVLNVPAHLQHPAVIDAPTRGRRRPIPMGLYLDG